MSSGAGDVPEPDFSPGETTSELVQKSRCCPSATYSDPAAIIVPVGRISAESAPVFPAPDSASQPPVPALRGRQRPVRPLHAHFQVMRRGFPSTLPGLKDCRRSVPVGRLRHLRRRSVLAPPRRQLPSSRSGVETSRYPHSGARLARQGTVGSALPTSSHRHSARGPAPPTGGMWQPISGNSATDLQPCPGQLQIARARVQTGAWIFQIASGKAGAVATDLRRVTLRLRRQDRENTAGALMLRPANFPLLFFRDGLHDCCRSIRVAAHPGLATADGSPGPSPVASGPRTAAPVPPRSGAALSRGARHGLAPASHPELAP